MLGLHAADLATLMHVQHGMYLASWHAQTCDSPLLKVTNTVDISALSLESEDGTKDVCNYMQRLLRDIVTNLKDYVQAAKDITSQSKVILPKNNSWRVGLMQYSR